MFLLKKTFFTEKHTKKKKCKKYVGHFRNKFLHRKYFYYK